jgi:putative transposase
MKQVQLVEQHRIDRYDPRWQAIDAAAFASKNLYNAALYQTRQAYVFEHHKVLSYSALDKLMQPTEAYCALPAKVAQWVIKQVTLAWKSYFAVVEKYAANPASFTGHPGLPKYLDKQKGRNLLVYTNQAIGHYTPDAGWVVPSGMDIRIATAHAHQDIDQVRIVPKATHYVVEVVYEREAEPKAVDPALIASIDLGVNNLAAITSNKPGFIPRLVNGRPLKSLNQGYNKQREHRQKHLPKDQHNSRALDELTDHRHRAITSYLHTASRAIIDLLVKEGIGTLVIGKNVGWKQEVNLGKQNNQSFVFIPHARFIDLLSYKAALVGIHVILVEESYTSKCSFLDGEDLAHHDRYLGKRVKRGWFVSSSGRAINADVNGSYNILRKAVPGAFAQGIEQVKLHPLWLSLPDRRQDRRKQSRTPQATG